MISKTDNLNFQSRIEKVLNGRKKHQWGHALGLSSGSVTRLTSGEIPKWEILSKVAEAERASLDWLTTGKGAPFVVIHFHEEEDAKEWLSDYLSYSPDAQLYLVRCGTSEALVTRITVTKEPAEKDPIHFNELNVVCGVDQHTLATVELDGIDLRRLDLYDDEFKRLVQGETGNQTLLKLIERSRPFNPDGYQIADPGGDYNTTKTGSSQGGGADLTPDEEALLKKYRALNADNRRRLQAITFALDVTLDADVNDPT